MNDLVLVCVNWNQRPAMELMLKSYVKYHYDGEPLNLILVDNGSTDDSKEWLYKNEIPFVDLHQNHGHENALNIIYKDIKTKYCLLVDSDTEFYENVYDYHILINDECKSVGELIDKNFMNEVKIKDRISPWFWMWDAKEMRKRGMKFFRDPDCHDWTYDVASWHWEQIKGFGFTNYNIERKNFANQDTDIVSMVYDRFGHIGKVSWDLSKHQDREGEVMKRRAYINDRLKLHNNIDLKGKFIL